MAELDIKGNNGKSVGKHELADVIANAELNALTLHRAVIAEQANSRQGTQKTKTRAEARGGGRKPYRQKKTGNARQGSIRSPHYAHGGMALAVMPRDYTKRLNRKERRSAIIMALAARINEGALLLTESVAIQEPKTKSAVELLKALGVDQERRVLVVTEEYDETTYKSFRNLPNVTVRTAPARAASDGSVTKTNAFSTRDLLLATKIVMSKDAMKAVEEVWAK